MTQTTGRITLWRNIAALMHVRYKKEHLGKLAQEAGIGAATMTRIKECSVSTGVDQLDKIARAFGVEAWQLLKPDLDVLTLSSKQSPAAKTTPQADAENIALVIAAIPKEMRKTAVLEATQLLIGYLVPVQKTATPSPTHDVTQASIK